MCILWNKEIIIFDLYTYFCKRRMICWSEIDTNKSGQLQKKKKKKKK